MDEHIPVLLDEAIDSLGIKPNGIYVDLTLGRAGHASQILARLNRKGRLIGIDQDAQAIENSKIALSKIGSNFETVHENFRNFKEVLYTLNIQKVDGILMDLGVSSPQFDDSERGFSYRSNARLDMRMDERNSLTAYEIVNTYSVTDLARIFGEYGEDKYAYQIARKIAEARISAPVVTTQQLVDLIKSAKPMKELAKKGHPAKQIFQALRIEVNDELGALEITIKDALKLLNVGGRLVVISFQSLEDRLIKEAFRKVTVVEGTRRNVFSLPKEEEMPKFRLIHRKIVTPSAREINRNPRSRSAKLRAIERIKE
ncbi:MAG: 16S rRNA (cytosine(1402)-N(4))-methyltransferase RsmH [Bacilli bacterium]|jgi:16S rRNA (cytosine1402-N4)-methyltransferase|nr:16S rRNA (cytosine(1402)-N(4))-methyltransferase RsmH [Bacilli bacterium]MDD4303230.1 16S rRNA (cytosine(1402)-N(4))-methyltransferase RsmH [Bacilli bacterium]HNY74381.1 16S rRNA (cytosine(1402)-N(4))-methyltransferase RsmH [Bacilli bacterium]HOF53914.1 16S rRNA (cytosine(1402)-N(4))-methyltransferase RsmH [Bacilli bacterium]HOH68019.1 16S rRNA (cytosine(1402)-N(4))-methyltransferase RsmH [Bacilli bacterium]